MLVQDLNLGDLAVYLECSLAFNLKRLSIEDYPGLHKIYKIMLKIPEFQEIDIAFGEFTAQVLKFQTQNLQPSPLDHMREVWASVKFMSYLKWNKIDMFASKREFDEALAPSKNIAPATAEASEI